jgi:hypothetical protein
MGEIIDNYSVIRLYLISFRILVCHLAALALITCLLVQCPAREFIGITLGYDQQLVFSPFHFAVTQPATPLKATEDGCSLLARDLQLGMPLQQQMESRL